MMRIYDSRNSYCMIMHSVAIRRIRPANVVSVDSSAIAPPSARKRTGRNIGCFVRTPELSPHRRSSLCQRSSRSVASFLTTLSPSSTTIHLARRCDLFSGQLARIVPVGHRYKDRVCTSGKEINSSQQSIILSQICLNHLRLLR